MRSQWIVGVVGIFGMMGCATSNGVGARDARGVAMDQPQGVRAGEARVVDARINPRVRVRVTSENGALAVRFAHPRALGALVHLDAGSLAPVAPEEQIEAELPTAPATGIARVVLHDGRFIECWRRGDMESGYRLMAQAWTAGGAPLGPPTAVSPPEADVFATPDLVAVDGDHAVATFAAISGARFELLAVSLEVL
jgi:hypothetical protein